MKASPEKSMIIFDFDGVIVDSFSVAFSVSQELAHITDIDEFRSVFDGNVFDRLKMRQSVTDLEAHREKWFTLYGPQLFQLPPVQGISEVITTLAKTHTLTIVSSTSSVLIATFLHQHSIDHFFERVLGSDDHYSKVHKINSLLKDFFVSPARALMITDTLGDIREADVAQVTSVAVGWGYHEKDRLAQGEPRAVVHTPQELLETINQYFSDHGPLEQ